MKLRKIRAFALGALVLAACSSDRSGERSGGKDVFVVPPPDAVTSFVAHRDTRLANAPSFLWLAAKENVRFADAHEAASFALKSIARSYSLSDAALAAIEAPEIDDTGSGPIVARAKQRIGGIEVFRGSVAVAMRRDFQPVAARALLAQTTTGIRPFARDARTAVDDAFASLGRGALSFTEVGVRGEYQHFTAEGLSQEARAKKVLFPVQTGPTTTGLEPAYFVEIPLLRGPAWAYVVSATDGRVLLAYDMVRYEAFNYRVYADPTTKLPFDGPQGNGAAPHPAGRPDGSRPTWGSMELVSLQNFPFSKNDPWLAADATTTVGNNVRAYPDVAQPDGAGGDTPVALTGERSFDYAYDTSQAPNASSTNVQAAATHLFYVLNFLHDWYYDAGYDEKSGNHQNDNFGRGGLGRDSLRAEAQDYSGTNNANAQVPADGQSPIIQMFVFSGPSAASLEVHAPAPNAGSKPVGLPGSFGTPTFHLKGDVVLGLDDAGGDANDACEPLTNNVAGKIVLVHRGTCSFVQKAQNVQAAGGTGAIIANVATSAQPTIPPFMGGTANSIEIPVLSLSFADGQALEKAIPAGVSVTMHREPQTDLDGALDTMVVAHEWGHVLSGRLVHDGAGLTTNQSGGLGEGWGDFSALMLMARPDDVASPAGTNWTGAYPNGAYAMSGAGADFYFGIRRLPYSVDFAKNPLTFKHITSGVPLPTLAPISFGEDGSQNAEVHAAGEVWATMLWECYVALLRKHPFADAQERMKRYFVASLKLTPADPTMLEARDAVLAAAFAADEGDYRLFWEAFGRRGAGVGAEGPPKDSPNNAGVKESFYVGNDVQIADATITDDVISCDHDGILDEGEVGTLTVTVRNAGPGALAAPVAKLSSAAGIKFMDGAEVKLAPLKPFEATKLEIRAQITAAKSVEPVAIEVLVVDPSFPDGRVQKISVATRYNADEAPESSTIDRVDTKATSWKVASSDKAGLTLPWTRVKSGLDGRWAVVDVPESAEQTLTSPEFTIEGTTFELAFRHRHSFRFSTRRQVDIDGGVVEVSVDNGRTWKDLSEFGKVDYNTTLDETRNDGPLAGRRAYGNKSAGYPDAWVSSRINVNLRNHPESVRVRFRAGTATGFIGAPGWEVDDIELGGTTSKPFWSFVAHEDFCDEKGPTVNAGPGRNVKGRTPVSLVGSGTHPANLPLTFVWTQVAGPTVETKSDGAKLDFVAPDLKEAATLTFALRAHDGALLSPASRVDVAVGPSQTDLEAEGGGCGCRTGASTSPRTPFAPFALLASAVALLAARRRRA